MRRILCMIMYQCPQDSNELIPAVSFVAASNIDTYIIVGGS